MKINRSHTIPRTVLLTLSMLAAVACSADVSKSPSPLATPSVGALHSPLPSLIAVIPTPSGPDKVTITGMLLQDTNAPHPVAGAILYLADVLPDSAGKLTLASFDKVSSPHAQTDSAGRFVFADVPAKTYSLVLYHITDSYLLKDPTSNGDLLFKPEPGKVLDVGKLVYSSLPSDGAAP